MGALALLQKLREIGCELRPEGDQVRVRYPAGVMTDELRAAIREHKAALIALLSRGEAGQEEVQSSPAPTVPADRILSAPPLGQGGGRSLTGADGITLALSLQLDGTCYCCKGSRWWLSRYGVLICTTCHPPAVPGLVARYVDGEEAVRLARA